ncbi:polysaccharide lyase family 8 super-sandwich domain-containing protein [Chryseobacterium sp. Chry.R1]|uniref:polysaccharide lyase family 8 super-sandwich domain-containing protein n=1 Tax=Chryseobacterium sp. Chry.R1 TaxID=3139392 RepID=UPI0031F8A6D6
MRERMGIILFLLGILLYRGNDFEVIRLRIVEEQWENINNRSQLLNDTKSFSQLLQNGFWKDIDYTSKVRSPWPPAQHLQRVKMLTIAYTAPWSSLKGDFSIFEKISTALSYWNQHECRSTNWWHNEIGTPRTLGLILVMMQQTGAQKLAPVLQDSLIEKMNVRRFNGTTGVNKIDFDMHLFFIGILKQDPEITMKAIEGMYSVNVTTDKEGIQPDFSYAQHDIMLHIFGYGSEYFKGQASIGYITRETAFKMKERHLRILSNFVRKGILAQIRGRYINHNTFGRQISRKNFTDAIDLIPYLEKMKRIDPEYKSTYDDALARILEKKDPGYHIKQVFSNYWRTDFASVQNKRFLFSVKGSSIHTAQAETDYCGTYGHMGNGENNKGGYRSIGSTTLLIDGNEYYNIYPIWDWAKIPGTTAPQKEIIPATDYITYGTSTFSGGVTNGKIGNFVFDMQNQFKTNARKSWFMFEDKIVALGTGISSDAKERVVTSVEQNWAKGDVYQLGPNSIHKIEAQDEKIQLEGSGLYHNNTAYIFPKKETIFFSHAIQSGSWNSIACGSKDPDDMEAQSKKVFKLWIDHGVHPNQADYEYIIYPQIRYRKARRIAGQQDICILKNDNEIQAVYEKSTQSLQAVFYQPGKLQLNDRTITVDKACNLIIEHLNNKHRRKIYASSPDKKEKTKDTIMVDVL